MKKMGLMGLASGFAVAAHVVLAAQVMTATLAPSGTLRAAFLATNPVQSVVDPQTKERKGPIPDLVAELGRRLDVPVSLIPSADAAAVIEAVATGKADIGFLAYEAERATQVDFSEPYAVMQNAYLVRADSPIKQSSDVDRAGNTVGAVKGQSQQIFVSSTFKSARVEVLPLMPSPEAIRKMITSGELNGFAANRGRMEAVAAGFPEVRVLSDNFLSLGQAIVVPKGDAARLRFINGFILDVRRTGLVKTSLDSSGISGLDVIP